MRALFLNRITLIWGALIVATAVSVEFVYAHVADYRWATVAALAIAFIKARFVGREFMDIRAAPLPLRLGFEAWLWLVGGGLIYLYLQT